MSVKPLMRLKKLQGGVNLDIALILRHKFIICEYYLLLEDK